MTNFLNLRSMTVPVLAMSLGSAGIAHADALTNGDFEDTAGWGMVGSTQPPPGWSDGVKSGGVSPAGQQKGQDAIGGSGVSAYLSAALDGILRQEFDPTPGVWQFKIDLASENPGGSNDRSFTGSLINGDNAFITFRVNGDGDLQFFDRDGGGWKTPGGLAKVVAFQEDVRSSPKAHRLTINADFDAATPVFDVILIDSAGTRHQASGLTGLWNTPAKGPTRGQGIEALQIHGGIVTGDYVIDNAVLGEPEPESEPEPS